MVTLLSPCLTKCAICSLQISQTERKDAAEPLPHNKIVVGRLPYILDQLQRAEHLENAGYHAKCDRRLLLRPPGANDLQYQPRPLRPCCWRGGTRSYSCGAARCCITVVRVGVNWMEVVPNGFWDVAAQKPLSMLADLLDSSIVSEEAYTKKIIKAKVR